MTDIFNIDQSQPLNDKQKDQITLMKRAAEKLLAEMKLPYFIEEGSVKLQGQKIASSQAERCISIAHARLEEAIMWASKGISSL